MIEVIIVGSSSGDPSPERANSAIIVKTSGSLYQFDAGEGFSSSIKRLKVDHDKICTVFISHMHPDHIAGLFMEIQMMFLAARREPLQIYLPSEATEPVRKFMMATYLFEDKMGFEIPVRPVTPDPVFRDDNIAVYSRANTHLEKYGPVVQKYGAPNKLQSYSYIIKSKKRKIIYSGDIGSVEDYADLLPECDLLITEGMHLDLEQLFGEVARHKVKHLILTHLPDDAYRKPGPLLDLARKAGVADLQLARDGLSLRI